MFFQLCSIPIKKIRLVTISSIYIIILSIQFYNIPCMPFCTSLRASIYINARNAYSFQKILNCTCISRTNCLFFPEDTCNTLIVITCLILGIINHISINNADFFIITGICRNQTAYFLKSSLHGILNLTDLTFCINISRGKSAVITV